MSFDAFIETAWNDHADRPQEVADRLVASLDLVRAPEQIGPLARLATHVYGEHLGQWQRGIAMLESLRGLPAFDGSPAAATQVVRGIATLRYAQGDRSVLDALPADERVCVLAAAAAVFAGRDDFGASIAAFGDALRGTPVDIATNSPAIRALAVGGNNLAVALEGKADRDSAETSAMVTAAEAGARYWKQAGTWLEEERAHYRLACSLLAAGQAPAARQSAERCVAVCAANDAPAFERFFADAALALACRASGDAEAFAAVRQSALAWHEQVPEADKTSCRPDLDKLG
ncbi:MAG: hypothetical protein ABJA61_01405 [Caldimonas sp.]